MEQEDRERLERCQQSWQAERLVYELGPEKAARYAKANPDRGVYLAVIGSAFGDTAWTLKFMEIYMEPD